MSKLSKISKLSKLSQNVKKRLSAISYQLIPRRGVTLLELVVVMGIFVICMNIIVAAYQSASGLHRRIIANQRTVSDLRFALESIADDVRIGTIDYEAYGAVNGLPISTDSACTDSGRCNILNLVDEDNVKSTICNGTAACVSSCSATTPCINVLKSITDKADDPSRIHTTSPSNLNAKGVIIDSLYFYIYPTVNPFCSVPNSIDNSFSNQPMVTITITGHGLGSDKIITLQTTSSSRVYRKVGSCTSP